MPTVSNEQKRVSKLVKLEISKQKGQYGLIRRHVVAGTIEQMDDHLRDMWDKMRYAHRALVAGNSMMSTAMMVSDEYNLSESQSYAIVRNSLKIFGDVVAADKKGLAHILTEMLTGVMKFTMEKGEYGTAVEAARQIAKINGLPMEEVKKKDKVLPKFIMPTSSEADLKKQMEELDKAQHIEYEEIDD